MDSASTVKNQTIAFDDSGLRASLNFLRDKSDQNLKKLISASGNKLAYNHYKWSNYGANMAVKEFWSKQLTNIPWSPKFENDLVSIQAHVLQRDRIQWLNEVLRYLPPSHHFKTTVYLNLGYDCIVFGEKVALNLGFRQFHVDKRESIYYLIHEVAHAGYLRYHPMPGLWDAKTNRELLGTEVSNSFGRHGCLQRIEA